MVAELHRPRAIMLAMELQAMGCSNLVLYIDGFELWEKHGGEVER